MRWPWWRKDAEDELTEELQFHLERQTAENVANGMEEREARRQAVMALDGVERIKEECRGVRIGNGVDNLVKDLRYAGRMLRRNPLFAASAAATLALGIGATTAIFSVTDSVLLRPLPYPDPGTEIGLRMAMGADTASIFRLIVGQGLRLTLIGIAAGLTGAAAVTHVLTTMLVGVKPTDASTFAAMTMLFLAIGAAASWLPAVRAAHLDLAEALRQE